MTLVQQIIAYLDGHAVTSALIGGFALAAHGIARATLDFDLLVVDRAVLEPPFWAAWGPASACEIRQGDAEDPLAGVVRLHAGAETVDVIVGKHPWQARILERRVQPIVQGQALPTVSRADLVLLKLFAGGPQDLLDVRLLLAADDGELRREVEGRLAELPSSVRTTWEDLRSENPN